MAIKENNHPITFPFHIIKKNTSGADGVEREYNQENSILELEKEVALGLWIQVIGQLIEVKGLTGLLKVQQDGDTRGEEQILTGAWIRTIGQILEAVSVSSQIKETDKIKLIQEQKIAIAGDALVSFGSGLEVIGGLRVLDEEISKPPSIVP